MTLSDEKILLDEIRKGNSAAFSEFYTHYFDMVHPFVKRYVKCSEIADDLVQEIFIRIWEKRASLPAINSLKSYLLVVARNYTFTFLKRAATEEQLKEQIISASPRASNSTEDQLESQEYQIHLNKVLSTLPCQSQKIFKLCREEEKSYQEVSALLGISRDAVKKHMVRSMKLLKLRF